MAMLDLSTEAGRELYKQLVGEMLASRRQIIERIDLFYPLAATFRDEPVFRVGTQAATGPDCKSGG